MTTPTPERLATEERVLRELARDIRGQFPICAGDLEGGELTHQQGRNSAVRDVLAEIRSRYRAIHAKRAKP